MGEFHRLFLASISVLVISLMRLSYIVVMMLFGGGGMGFGPYKWLRPDWFTQLPFFSVSLILRLMVLGFLLILVALMRNSKRPGFPIFVARGKGRPALRNSIGKWMGGFRFCLRCICPG